MPRRSGSASISSTSSTMAWWLAASCIWLAGTAVQLSEATLWPSPIYQGAASGAVVFAMAAGVALAGGRRTRAGSRDQLTQGAWRLCALLALGILSWSMTGWRAGTIAAQHIPPSLLDQDGRVRLQVEGLPRRVPGGYLFEAELLALSNVQGHWLPLNQDPAADQWSRHLTLRAGASDLNQPPRAGQQWEMTLRLHEPDGLSNPGGYDAPLALFERGVRGQGQVRAKRAKALLLSESPPWFWQGLVDRLRQRVRDRIAERVIDARAAGVLTGLSVGDQSAISHEDWLVFRKTGVAHLVSISGAHIAMFGAMAAFCLRRVWPRLGPLAWFVPAPHAAQAGAVMASAAYALLAGWGVPAQRTVWMMAVMALLKLNGRRWPWPLVWLTAATVVVALDPWALRQAGFWLSFVAVGVLMMPARTAEPARRPDALPANLGIQSWLHRAWQSTREQAWALLETQWRVTVGLMPLALVFFQQVSVVGFAANLWAIPVFTIFITPLALLGALAGPLWVPGAQLVQWTLQGLTTMSNMEWAVLESPALPGWVAVSSVLAAGFLLLPLSWRWRLIAIPFLLSLLYLPTTGRLVPTPQVGQFSVLAMDVGQGTAVLVRTSHHALLFDAGPKVGTQSDAGERVVVPVLRNLGVSALDELMISHQDTDHVGGAASVMRGVAVGALRTSLDDAHPLRHEANLAGSIPPHARCEAGQQWAWDEVRFTVLHPTASDYAKRDKLIPNALSCVLLVEAPSGVVGRPPIRALLAGDIEADQEAAILARARTMGHEALRSDLLVVPHHGSSTSSTAPFLSAVAPALAVIQAGRRNRYGHPSPSVTARYGEMNLPWVASASCGALLWSSDQATGPAGPNKTAIKQHAPRAGACWRQKNRHYWDAAQAAD